MTISPTFNSDEIYAWVEHQARLGARRPGSEADTENENFLENKLKEFGCENIRKEPIPITYWAAQGAQVEVLRNGQLETVASFPIPCTAFTPVDGVQAPLVYADPQKLWHRDDWRGKIVLTEIGFPPLDFELLLKIGLGSFDPDDTFKSIDHPATWVRLGWHLYRKAARRGAAGFIGIVKDQPGGSCQMYAPYGFKEKDILDKPIPGFWVSRDKTWLTELARSGDCAAKIKLTGNRHSTNTHNVVGEIPGQVDDEVVVLSCHHDSPFVSPVEDGSGVSVVLALAKHFAQTRDLNRRLIIVFTAGHFYGSIGTKTFINEHKNDVVNQTVCEITIEHIAREAVENDTGSLVESGKPEATGIFVPVNDKVTQVVLEAIQENDVRRVVLLPAEGPLGDYPPTDGGDWYQAGVPVINFISDPVYLLTNDDALHWVDQTRLAKVATAFAHIICKIDGMPKSTIRALDKPIYRLMMQILKRVSRAKTTRFGLKPVY